MLLEGQFVDTGSIILGGFAIIRWHGSHSAEVNENKPGLQSGPGLLLVSGLGFALGQSCFA